MEEDTHPGRGARNIPVSQVSKKNTFLIKEASKPLFPDQGGEQNPLNLIKGDQGGEQPTFLIKEVSKTLST